MKVKEENNYISFKDFHLKKDNIYYLLRIEIEHDFLNITLKKANISLDYFYKNKVKITEIINELKLDEKYKSNNYLILKIFDKIYANNKIIINIMDNSRINLKLEISNNIVEINLIKESISIDTKLNLIYDEIIKRKYNNNKIENIINLEFLNNKNSFIKNDEKIFKLNEINDKETTKGYIENIGIDELYKKIDEIYIEQKIYYENIMKEFIEFKNNIEKNINQTLIESKKYKINKEEQKNTTDTPIDDDIEIRYKVNKDKNNLNSIRIFGKKFVENNKNNFKILYRDEEFDLIEEFRIDNYDINKGFLIIKLKYINYTTDMSYMFSECNSEFEIINLNSYNITNLSYLFYGCNNLQTLPDLSKLDTSNVVIVFPNYRNSFPLKVGFSNYLYLVFLHF